MSFPRSLLAEHEEVVLELKPHWVALIRSVIWSIVFLAAEFIASRTVFNGNGVYQWWEILITVALVVGWFLLAVMPFLRWRYTLFVLTTDRLITRRGIIAKHSKEIPLERINDVAFSQSVLDRLLGAGDLMVESAGERGQTRIDNVRNPEQVQLAIYKESEKNNERMMRPSTADEGAAPSIPDQIEALARLRKQGVLDEDEYQAKKKQLLDRL